MAFHCSFESNPLLSVTAWGLVGLASSSLLDLIWPCFSTLSSLSDSRTRQACSCLRVLALSSPSARNALPQIFAGLVPLTIQVSSQISPPQRGLPWPPKPRCPPHPPPSLCIRLLVYFFQSTYLFLKLVFLFPCCHKSSTSDSQGSRDFVGFIHHYISNA